jgi:hypothetical protein
MSRLLLTSLAFGFFVAIFSCGGRSDEDREEQGLRKYYYPDGSLYMEIEVEDTIAHGKSKEYYRSGNLYQESTYVNGMKHGAFKRYYENGKIALECVYDSGRRHGVEKKYRKDGTLAYEAPYYYDRPTVGLKEYYPDGKLFNDYPSIVFQERKDGNRSSLLISLSKPHKVNFFVCELTDALYIGEDCVPVKTDVDGVGLIDYTGSQSIGDSEIQYQLADINIVAKVKTDLGNHFICQRKYTSN